MSLKLVIEKEQLLEEIEVLREALTRCVSSAGLPDAQEACITVIHIATTAINRADAIRNRKEETITLPERVHLAFVEE